MTALLALIGADTPVGYNSGSNAFPDFVRNRVFQYSLDFPAPLTGSPGMKILSGTTGLDLLQATDEDIFGAGPAHVFSITANGYHPGADQFFSTIDTITNSMAIAQINGTTLDLISIYGTASASFDASDGDHVTARFSMASATAAGNNYLPTVGIRSAGIINEVAVFCLSGTAMVLLYAFQMDENIGEVCAGSDGTFYAVAHDETHQPDPAGFYEFTLSGRTSGVYVGDVVAHLESNDYVTRRKIGTMLPTDLDDTWTNWLIHGPGFDRRDRNLVFTADTVDVVTNQQYIFKIDRITGALLWKTPISYNPSQQLILPRCNLNGQIALFDDTFAPNVTPVINLIDGSVTKPAFNNGMVSGSQWFDYATGSITINGSYIESTGPVPEYLGQYLADNDNEIPSGRWARMFLGLGGGGQSHVEIF